MGDLQQGPQLTDRKLNSGWLLNDASACLAFGLQDAPMLAAHC